jgi:hypothetical protein
VANCSHSSSTSSNSSTTDSSSSSNLTMDKVRDREVNLRIANSSSSHRDNVDRIDSNSSRT